MISITGRPGDPPQKTATTIGDYVAAAHIATAIAAALKEGVGRRVEVAVRDALISVQSGWNALHFAEGAQPPRTGTASPYLAPNQVLATADGHLTLAVTSDRHFAILCEVIDRPDLAERYPGNEERMAARIQARRRTGNGVPDTPQPRSGWNCWSVPVCPRGGSLTLPEVFADPQVQHNEMVVEIDDPVAEPVRTTGTPLRVDSAPARAVLPPPKLVSTPPRSWPSSGWAKQEWPGLDACDPPRTARDGGYRPSIGGHRRPALSRRVGRGADGSHRGVRRHQGRRSRRPTPGGHRPWRRSSRPARGAPGDGRLRAPLRGAYRRHRRTQARHPGERARRRGRHHARDNCHVGGAACRAGRTSGELVHLGSAHLGKALA